MKKLLLTFIFLTSLANAIEFKTIKDVDMMRSGDEVGNGAGLYENRLASTFLEIPDFIDIALSLEIFDNREFDILIKIQSSFDRILEETSVYFKDESDIFLIDGTYKLAITGSQIGAPIIFNLDKLYMIAPGVLKETLISTLIHEIGHLMGEEDHNFLDQLGAKVSRAANAQKTIFQLNFGDSTKYIEIYNFSDAGISSHIRLIYNDKDIDLAPYFESMTGCTSQNHFYNLHKNFITGEVQGTLLYRCLDRIDFQEVPFVIKADQDSETKKYIMRVEKIKFE